MYHEELAIGREAARKWAVTSAFEAHLTRDKSRSSAMNRKGILPA